jgi:hypothetical protein
MTDVSSLSLELHKIIFDFLLPARTYIKVHKRLDHANHSNEYHTSVVNHKDWSTVFHIGEVSRAMRDITYNALHDALKSTSVRLAMDMSDHEISSSRRVPDSELGREVPLKFLQRFSLLTVTCPYYFHDGLPEDHPAREDIGVIINASYYLVNPDEAHQHQPGTNDHLLTVYPDIFRDTATGARIAAFNDAVDGVIYGIEHPHVASAFPVPYLRPLSSKGLYRLGRLFAANARRVSQAKEDLKPGASRFLSRGHRTSVAKWVKAKKPDVMPVMDKEWKGDAEDG